MISCSSVRTSYGVVLQQDKNRLILSDNDVHRHNAKRGGYVEYERNIDAGMSVSLYPETADQHHGKKCYARHTIKRHTGAVACTHTLGHDVWRR